jgi:geranylgeranyl reductase family protein
MGDEPVIVGAGIVGCFLANELAKKGVKPLVIEEHREIGLPFKCGGLVSDRIIEIAKFPKEIILHPANKAILNFPDGSRIEISGREKAFVIDRVALDKFFYQEASAGGANFLLGEKFLDFWRIGEDIVVKTNKRKLRTNLLIGADGATSSIRKKLGIDYSLLQGLQVRVELKHDWKVVELFFDKEISSSFGWIIPETSLVARIGVMGKKNPRRKLELFLKQIGAGKVIDTQAGLIPICYPKRTCWDNILLVGDAAGQTKATTGGGIVTGIICARVASDAIVKVWEANNFSGRFLLENYETRWKMKIGKHLKVCYMLAKVLEKMENSDLVELAKLIRRPEIIGAIRAKGDMDFYATLFNQLLKSPAAISFMMKFCMRHPELLRFFL